jgi:DNA-binding SARP family transcriptional activator
MGILESRVAVGPADDPRSGIGLDLLDGFHLKVDSEPLEVPDNPQRLVAFVALRRRPVCRALVAGTLWPEKTESRASANLRSSLWRLNGASPRPPIICSGASLLLNPEVRLDVAALERHGWALLGGSTDPAMEPPPDLFSKELLPGWYEDWVVLERERLGQLQIRFLEALVHHLRKLGEFARAIDLAMRLVVIDPLRERSQLALIRALVDEGSWGRAQWQADHYCQLLDNAFGSSASAGFISGHRTLFPIGRVQAP